MGNISKIKIQNTTHDIRDANAYVKPSTGIPASDLAAGVIPSSLPASNTVSSVSSGNTNPVSSGAVYSAMDGLKLQKISQSDYDSLTTKDPNTLYVIRVS